MKLGKVMFVLFAFFIAFACLEIYAQDSKQIKILNNFGSIPFEDGKTIVAEVIFTGLDTNYTQSDEEEESLLTENKLFRHLREQRATITVNEEFYGYKVAKTVRAIREWLASNGYDKAEVIAYGEKLTKNEMKLIFSIKRGSLARVSEMVFEGNLNLTNEELVADFKQCRKIDWEIFDSRKYDYIARKCSLYFMFSKGYFKAKIQNINRRLVDDGYVVTIKVQEGVRYRIGEIKIEGAKAFTKKEILEIFGQKEGDVVNGEKLQNFVYEKLKSVYADKGYILYNAEWESEFIEPQVEGLDGIVNFDITIDEGKAFKIVKIRFWSDDAKTEKTLKENFPIKEGEIYNQSKFKDEIEKINEKKEFYFVDDERDVELRTNEETGELEIFIKVKKLD